MGIHVVKVPDIGEGIAEVELVEWHVRPGDAVVADQILADVMTDKATVEVPSPITGTVIAVNGKPGDKLAVGSELLRLGDAAGGHSPISGERAAAVARRRPPHSGCRRGRTPRRRRPHRTRSRSRRRRCVTTRASWAWISRRSAGPGPADESCTTTSCDTRPVVPRNRPSSAALCRARRRTPGPGDRAAPANRAAHAGIAAHSALHLRGGSRRYRARGAAFEAQRAIRRDARPAHDPAVPDAGDRACRSRVSADERALRRRSRAS